MCIDRPHGICLQPCSVLSGEGVAKGVQVPMQGMPMPMKLRLLSRTFRVW